MRIPRRCRRGISAHAAFTYLLCCTRGAHRGLSAAARARRFFLAAGSLRRLVERCRDYYYYTIIFSRAISPRVAGNDAIMPLAARVGH